MTHQQVVIHTADGECPASVFTSGDAGPWPAAIFYMDGLGIRPVLFEMAQRLADAGFVVLLPDLFYRAGPYEPLDTRAVFASGNPRQALGPLMASTDNQRASQDTAAFLAYLASRDDDTWTVVGQHRARWTHAAASTTSSNGRNGFTFLAVGVEQPLS